MNVQKIVLNNNFGNQGAKITKKIKLPYDKTRELISADIKRKVDYIKSTYPSNILVVEDVIEDIYRKGIELSESLHVKL